MDIKELAQTFWQQGYLVIEDFFSDELTNKMHDLIMSYYGVDPEYCHDEDFLELSATEVIPWFPQLDNEHTFDVAENDAQLNMLTTAILGNDWRSLYCMTMFSKPNTKGQAWHQDCTPEDPTQFNMNRLVYTHDISDESGGQVVVVPGSHRLGEITVGEIDEDFDNQVVICPKRGTLLLLHGHAWHRVYPMKNNYRVSTNYRCIPNGVPDNVTDICVYRNMRYQFETKMVIEDRTIES